MTRCELEDPPLTDAGNGERFARARGRTFRHVGAWGRWLFWDGRRWVPGEERARLEAVEVARAIFGDSPRGKAGDDARKWALKSEMRSRIEAMLALAGVQPGIVAMPEAFDRDPWLLSVENGTLDLGSGELREHRPEDMITKLAPVTYDPAARAPVFEEFLARVLPDAPVRDFVQRAVGYSVTGDISEHVLFFLHGRGSNGKSTLLEAIGRVLGSDYARPAAPGLLLASRHERHPTELADLRGARLVSSIEATKGRAWDEERVKWVTGGDRLKARFMRGDFFGFEPTHKLWVAANDRPRVRGADNGIWRRLRLVPFRVEIPEGERDPHLGEKLAAEAPGILAWAVRGCLARRREGLGAPAAVRQASSDYREEEDRIGSFIEERCFTGERDVLTPIAALYKAYREWADANGERPLTANDFGQALEERGFPRKDEDGKAYRRGRGRDKARRGIRLRPPAEPPFEVVAAEVGS
jgi:putative DNA primase/helicase